MTTSIQVQQNPCLMTWEAKKGHKTMMEGSSHYCQQGRLPKHLYHVCPCGNRRRAK